MNVLFFLRTRNLDRLYEPLLEELIRRGHVITIVVERDRDLATGAGGVVDRLAEEHDGCTVEVLPALSDRFGRIRKRLRTSVDYLRYLEPEFSGSPSLRDRARRRAPTLLGRFEKQLADRARLRAALRAALRRAEHAVPVNGAARAFLAGRRTDVVLVAPLVTIGSTQSDWIRAARALGVPSVLPVASWDNLTNKGVIKDAPDATIVWNQAQADEAVRFQELPSTSVVVAGAHPFDVWFNRQPSSTSRAFRQRVGLSTDRPFFLYLASSRFIAGDETGFVESWIAQVRASADPGVRDAGILVRPHPLNADHWAGFTPPDGVVVWPTEGAMPTGEPLRRDYFDSLTHAAAVIGVNTSGLIEAAIAGTPSLTVLMPRFEATQAGTLHFAHISGDDGLLLVARSWDEHRETLSEVLARPAAHRQRLERFLLRFVRPFGLDTAAAPRAADAIEALAIRKAR